MLGNWLIVYLLKSFRNWILKNLHRNLHSLLSSIAMMKKRKRKLKPPQNMSVMDKVVKMKHLLQMQSVERAVKMSRLNQVIMLK